MTLKLAQLKFLQSDLSAQWSFLYNNVRNATQITSPCSIFGRKTLPHTHFYLYLRKVLLGVRLRDSRLTLHQRRAAAKRTRLINYQVECPVSKFDLEHKFRYSGELSSTLCTYGILCMYRLVYRVVYLCWLFRTVWVCVCVFSTIFWLSFICVLRCVTNVALGYVCFFVVVFNFIFPLSFPLVGHNRLPKLVGNWNSLGKCVCS